MTTGVKMVMENKQGVLGILGSWEANCFNIGGMATVALYSEISSVPGIGVVRAYGDIVINFVEYILYFQFSVLVSDLGIL